MTEKKTRDLFWLWVVMAFVAVIAAWGTLFAIARDNPNPQIEVNE